MAAGDRFPADFAASGPDAPNIRPVLPIPPATGEHP